MFFKNEKNVYNVLKLCIFYKSIANKKMYYFYIISILDFLLFFIGIEQNTHGIDRNCIKIFLSNLSYNDYNSLLSLQYKKIG